MNSVWDKITSLKPDYKIIAIDDIYSDIMDNRYLTICYYNLLEKYIRGGIRQEDWNKIEEVYEVK